MGDRTGYLGQLLNEAFRMITRLAVVSFVLNG